MKSTVQEHLSLDSDSNQLLVILLSEGNIAFSYSAFLYVKWRKFYHKDMKRLNEPVCMYVYIYIYIR